MGTPTSTRPPTPPPRSRRRWACVPTIHHYLQQGCCRTASARPATVHGEGAPAAAPRAVRKMRMGLTARIAKLTAMSLDQVRAWSNRRRRLRPWRPASVDPAAERGACDAGSGLEPMVRPTRGRWCCASRGRSWRRTGRGEGHRVAHLRVKARYGIATPPPAATPLAATPPAGAPYALQHAAVHRRRGAPPRACCASPARS